MQAHSLCVILRECYVDRRISTYEFIYSKILQSNWKLLQDDMRYFSHVIYEDPSVDTILPQDDTSILPARGRQAGGELEHKILRSGWELPQDDK